MRFVHYVAAIAFLAALYVGGYYAIVQRNVVALTNFLPREVYSAFPETVDGKTVWKESFKFTLEEVVEYVPNVTYRFEAALGESTMRSFFQPMHWLDRQIRTEYWFDPPVPPLPPLTPEPPIMLPLAAPLPSPSP